MIIIMASDEGGGGGGRVISSSNTAAAGAKLECWTCGEEHDETDCPHRIYVERRPTLQLGEGMYVCM